MKHFNQDQWFGLFERYLQHIYLGEKMNANMANPGKSNKDL